ncbi:Sulfotransferase 1 family member D1 [Exaiptasia diaphana]|nr:Sulfotransferase 1 family member D1 [Exaiptasia diaphana]
MSKKTKYQHPEILPMIDGVLHFPGLSKTWLGYLKDLPVQTDRDVIIDTYPKSGTTWVSEVTLEICHEGLLDYTPIHKRVPFMEECTNLFDTKEKLNEFFLNHPSPRFFKSHLPYHQVPMGYGTGDKPKYIYTIRNPKDVAVSYYYHYEGFKPLEFVGRSWDEFFEMFITDQGMPVCCF